MTNNGVANAKELREMKEIEVNGKPDVRKLTFTELASMLHGLLFAYEKVFINLYGDDARQLYPYIIDELSCILHGGDNPVIDEEKSLEENIERFIEFISNEEYLKDISLERDDGRYVFKVGSCTFAKSGVHEILKVKEGVCPFGLMMASLITELTPDTCARITKSEFDETGSKVSFEMVNVGEDDGDDGLMRVDAGMEDDMLPSQSVKPPMDEFDLKLIRELRRDGRQSNVDIARVLKVTESTVRRRINSLIDRGIIKGFTALLNYAPGESFLRAFIGIKVRPAQMESVLTHLVEMKEICSVYKTIGRYNLMCEVISTSRDKFQQLIDTLQYMEGVDEMEYSIGSSSPKPCPWYGF